MTQQRRSDLGELDEDAESTQAELVEHVLRLAIDSADHALSNYERLLRTLRRLAD